VTAGLILAAGLGTRFGGRKMLASVRGRPMLQWVLDLAEAAELEPVVVVLGQDADDIEAALDWRHELLLRNPDPAQGISSSVNLGLEALTGSADRVLVMLGDQPFLSVEQVNVITSADADPARPIVVPRYSKGRKGNPVLLEHAAWRYAAELEGDRGMSQLFKRHRELVRYVELEGKNPDIDSAEDLAKFSPS
jgi:molybdenum cofactor cytidylyltransferase